MNLKYLFTFHASRCGMCTFNTFSHWMYTFHTLVIDCIHSINCPLNVHIPCFHPLIVHIQWLFTFNITYIYIVCIRIAMTCMSQAGSSKWGKTIWNGTFIIRHIVVQVSIYTWQFDLATLIVLFELFKVHTNRSGSYYRQSRIQQLREIEAWRWPIINVSTVL